MMLRRLALVLAFGCAPVAFASLTVYKSVDRDGAVTYAQAPVKGAAQVTAIEVRTLSDEERLAAFRERARHEALVLAQTRRAAEANAAWERADEEVRLAREALERAEARLASGPEVREGDWLGNANGRGTRPSPEYLERAEQLEARVVLARLRLDRAIEARNALR